MNLWSSEAKTRDLASQWLEEWPAALSAWSSYTLLREPLFFESQDDAESRSMSGEIAAIRLTDHTISVNLATIRERHLESHARAILAHEIGHHVYVPGNLTDNARLLAAISRMLTGLPRESAFLVSNLYADLLINDRLQRRAGIDMAAVYRALKGDGPATRVWNLYARTCEELWRLPHGAIAPVDLPEEMESDAALLARVVRNFAGEWLRGARRFAAIVYRWLAEDEMEKRQQPFAILGLGDMKGAGRSDSPGDSTIPDGLASIDPSEIEDDDGFDDDITDPLGRKKSHRRGKAPNTAPTQKAAEGESGQYRQPFEYGQLLKNLGLDLTDHEITTRYYRERALPWLIPFPKKRAPRATEPLAEGYSAWEATDPLEDFDALGSVLNSPVAIPGVTTVQRVYGESPGAEPARVPVDLDIYVDSSGSMPNPAVDVSYLALAAAILSLSALRAGASVQATLWSGAGEFETSGGFVRNEKQILGIVTGSICGATAFPLGVLRRTYETRKAGSPPAHIVVISDNGADTMLAADEKGQPGEAVCRAALAAAKGGGTLVLNLFDSNWPPGNELEKIGFRVHAVTAWDQLVRFARDFVRENYGDDNR